MPTSNTRSNHGVRNGLETRAGLVHSELGWAIDEKVLISRMSTAAALYHMYLFDRMLKRVIAKLLPFQAYADESELRKYLSRGGIDPAILRSALASACPGRVRRRF